MTLTALTLVSALATVAAPASAEESSPLPSVTLPPELARVLTDYEAAWRGKDASALARLFGGSASSLTATTPAPSAPNAPAPPSSGAAAATPDQNELIREAARDLADYQRLTAEGKLGEAGQKLEALKQKLDRLAGSRR